MNAPTRGEPAGWREAHAHLAQHGRAMTMLQLSDCADLAECIARVEREAARLAAARSPSWLMGVGLRVESWPQRRFPTAAELDAAGGGRPTALWSFDHHAIAAGSAALAAGGIGEHSPDPDGGVIERDGGGRLTGLVLESAARMVWSAAPEPTPAERRAQVKAAADDLASHGFAEVHDLLAPAWLGPVLADLHDAGELPVRVWLYPRVEELEAVAAGAGAWQRGRVRLAGGKFFADGTLNSRTAWMLEPYADPRPGLPRGQPVHAPGEIEEAVRRAAGLGLGLAVHAIGDAAVRAVLDAWERVAPSAGRGRESPRAGAEGGRPFSAPVPALRVEHAEVIDAADVPRFARLGVVCSVQPCHLLADVEALRAGLPHRLDRVLPLRELIDSGCRPGESLWFGSDAPIVRPHPADSLRAAVHRRREGAPPGAAIGPSQAIADSEARACFEPVADGAGRSPR